MILGRREGVLPTSIMLQTGTPQSYPQSSDIPVFEARKEAQAAILLARQVSDRLSTIEGDIRKLQTSQKHLELEWTELYDKVRHAMSRISKRAERAEKAAALEPEFGNGADQLEAPVFVDPISAKILARRERGAIKR